MKLKFKKQAFQNEAVQAVVDLFQAQGPPSSHSYRLDLGLRHENDKYGNGMDLQHIGYRNADVHMDGLLENLQAVQRRQNLPVSQALKTTGASKLNFDIEMETGTGKTYCYIKTMFELHKKYGWGKFIVVVPSIAIREGVYKTLDITADHFMEEYGHRARSFIYDSKQLHHLENFSSGSGIQVMVINVQAFNTRGKDARKIYEALDSFQSRKPIDVIKGNRPILILDEPQKMEGKKTLKSFEEFDPLMILRYSATHKTQHDKVYRLDALDAFNQKLVKKIAVRGISVKGLTGTNAYLYLESIEISAQKPPTAIMEIEVRQQAGIKRIRRKLNKGDNLHTLSKELEEYQGFVVGEIDAHKDVVRFLNGVELTVGEATGDVNEEAMRRIQIRETIKAHLEKERALFHQGIKVLSLFFIDEVAKYRMYDDTGEVPGEYARIFEEEYTKLVNEHVTLFDPKYARYAAEVNVSSIHNGYFSIDKKGKMVNAIKAAKSEKIESTDQSAYDLILKDKERLLSFQEPTRFIFSHSALREGWDNPNVFTICTLKHSDNTVSKRQEVGRGLRLCVNQHGERMDAPATVHQTNLLTVVASESYTEFVTALQKDIRESLAERPRVADVSFFSGKILRTPHGEVTVTPELAKQIYRYLVKNDYTDDNDHISQEYIAAKEEGALAPLPDSLTGFAPQVFNLIDSVFSDALLPDFENGRKTKANPRNANYHKKEFQTLWERINQKAAYLVEYDSNELVKKCVHALDLTLCVAKLKYKVQRGEQKDQVSYEEMTTGEVFQIKDNKPHTYQASIGSGVTYDLLGKIAEETELTRHTVAEILHGINKGTFRQFKINPEDFIGKASRTINEQKATMIVEHLTYCPIARSHSIDIFTKEKPKADFSRAVKANHHIYDYVFTDSKNEQKFVHELDTCTDVVVYAKLPGAFFIPTPVGNYNPDWAIAFTEGSVKHIYFVAETKGSMSTMDLRHVEEAKIKCAKKFFTSISADQVTYDVVDNYDELMQLVQ